MISGNKPVYLMERISGKEFNKIIKQYIRLDRTNLTKVKELRDKVQQFYIGELTDSQRDQFNSIISDLEIILWKNDMF